jgi:cytochrome c oxidase subunit 3
MSDASSALREPFEHLSRQREAVSLGVWAFLASEVLFFGGLFIGYAVYRHLYPLAFVTAAKETDIVYGTLNTGILMTSSLTMAVAARAAEHNIRRMAIACLLATAALGCAFLVVKGFEYHDDTTKGLVPGAHFPLRPAETQIFWAFYWVMTGVHAIHLIVGVGVVTTVTVLLIRESVEPESPMFEGIALYWHLVDIIWVVLLPLLYLIGRNT